MTHTVAKLDPITDPLVLRDKTMESYAHNVRRQGVEPDMEYIRALAEADLGMVENYDRSIAGKVQQKAEAAPTPTERKRDDDPVSTYAKENNLRIHVWYDGAVGDFLNRDVFTQWLKGAPVL